MEFSETPEMVPPIPSTRMYEFLLLKFFNWTYANGGKAAADLDYVPMPPAVVTAIQKSWGDIKDNAGKPVAYK